MLILLVVLLVVLVLGMLWATAIRRESKQARREAFSGDSPTVVVQGHAVPLYIVPPTAKGSDASLFPYADSRCDPACCDTSDTSCDRGCVCVTPARARARRA